MRRSSDVRRLLVTIFALLVTAHVSTASAATPAITMDVTSGEVLYQKDATQRWYPASTTKLMTVYVALSAVRDRQIAMDTPIVVSARAHAMPPSKMGFPVGTQVTLDNALKMLMVRSANDIAISVAEGIAGSVEAFAEDMNQSAAQLGMRESHFVNPNGLPDSGHVSSARDMAILARALYTQFPEQAGLFNLGELVLGNERIPNHNNLLGRYPDVDGMKTGFTCSAGFNIVASAFRDGRRVVVVVFGAPSVAMRSEKVAALFDRAFAGVDRPINSVLTLPSSGSGWAPDMHDQVCRARGRLIATFGEEVAELDAPLMTNNPAPQSSLLPINPARAFLLNTNNVASATPMALRINSMPTPVFDPVPIHIGADPGYTGVVAQARAPHTPIGSDTPPATAEAYAASQPSRIAGSPLGIDPAALPLKGRRRVARQRSRGTMKAAAEAPVTQLIAGKEGAEEKVAAPSKDQMTRTHATDGKAKSIKAQVASKTKVTSRKSEPNVSPAAKKMSIGDGDDIKTKKSVKSSVKKEPGQTASASGKPKPKTKSADGA